MRLVNGGFGAGAEHDAQFEGMTEGWRLFMFNLRLHLEHFAGRDSHRRAPHGDCGPAPGQPAWETLSSGLGIPAGTCCRRPHRGDGDRRPRSGRHRCRRGPTLGRLGARPARLTGTAFLAVEGDGEHVTVSIWSYLYGPEGAAAAARDDQRWRQWLAERAAAPGR